MKKSGEKKLQKHAAKYLIDTKLLIRQVIQHSSTLKQLFLF